MNKSKFLLFVTVFVFCSVLVVAQVSDTTRSSNLTTSFNPNLSKGKSQIAIEGLNFGFGSGRINAGLGIRYGYFIANNSMIFLNGNIESWGESYFSYKVGLNYRQYFNLKKTKITPYVQVGGNIGQSKSYLNSWQNNYGFTLGGGISFNVNKFGFDIGMQADIWDRAFFKPAVGVSYTF